MGGQSHNFFLNVYYNELMSFVLNSIDCIAISLIDIDEFYESF